MLYVIAGKVAKVTVVEFMPLEVWEVSSLEPCKWKMPLFFNRRSRTRPLWDPTKTMETRLKEKGNGASSQSHSYQSLHIFDVEGLDLVRLIF